MQDIAEMRGSGDSAEEEEEGEEEEEDFIQNLTPWRKDAQDE